MTRPPAHRNRAARARRARSSRSAGRAAFVPGLREQRVRRLAQRAAAIDPVEVFHLAFRRQNRSSSSSRNAKSGTARRDCARPAPCAPAAGCVPSPPRGRESAGDAAAAAAALPTPATGSSPSSRCRSACARRSSPSPAASPRGKADGACDGHQQRLAGPVMLETVGFGRAAVTRARIDLDRAVPVAERKIVEARRAAPGPARSHRSATASSEKLRIAPWASPMRIVPSRRGFAVHPFGQVAARPARRAGRRQQHGVRRKRDRSGLDRQDDIVRRFRLQRRPELRGLQANRDCPGRITHRIGA